MSSSTKPRINPDYTWFRLELIKSPIHRWGVIALQRIPRGRYVIEYTGKLLNRRQVKARGEQEFCYDYQLDSRGYWTLDGAVGGSGAERVNHSCNPNLRVVFHGKRAYYMSRRPIKKGEELTVDYHFKWDPDDIKPCNCGDKLCRGTINDPY